MKIKNFKLSSKNRGTRGLVLFRVWTALIEIVNNFEYCLINNLFDGVFVWDHSVENLFSYLTKCS